MTNIVAIYLLNNCNDELIRWQAIRSLGKIENINKEITDIFINILIKGKIPSRYLIVESLSKIAIEDEYTINNLIEIIHQSDDIVTINCAVNILGKIAKDNEKAIKALIYLLENNSSLSERLKIAQNINEIVKGHPQAISTWLDIVTNGDNYYIRYAAIRCLSQVAVGNQTVIRELKRIAKIKGKEQSIIDGKKIAQIGLWSIDDNLFKRTIKKLLQPIINNMGLIIPLVLVVLIPLIYVVYFVARIVFFPINQVYYLYLWFKKQLLTEASK